jgi:hypothetical protein
MDDAPRATRAETDAPAASGAGTATDAAATAQVATDRRDRVDARWLLFGLFVTMAVVGAAFLVVFVKGMGDCDNDGIHDSRDPSAACKRRDGTLDPPFDGNQARTIVYRALAGDMAAPVAAWFLLVGIGRKGQPDRWFYFAAAAPAGLMTAILVMLGLWGIGEL